MSAVRHLLDELKRQGVGVAVRAGRLELEYPIDGVAAGLLEDVQAHEQGLVAYLAQAAPAHAPLSFAQQRLWFLDQLEQGSAQYNQYVGLRLQGAIDVDCMQRAFDAILARHESLRTTFSLVDKLPCQVVQAPRPLPLRQCRLGEDDPAQTLAALAAEEAHRPFDLAHDLMLRATLVWTGAGRADAVLMVTLHHIASDGWSIGILIREFVALYTAYRERRPDPLAPLPMQYGAYAAWQRERLQGDVLARQLSYWTRQLQDIPAVHGLPLDRRRPAQQDLRGACHRWTVPADLERRLKALAQRQRTTLFVVLHSALAALFHARGGQDDILIGIPVAGRSHLEHEGLIGFFANTLVLRSRIDPEMSFNALLAQTDDTALAAYEHQEIPFQMLVDHLNPGRSLSHSPVFQIMFSLFDNNMAKIALPGIDVDVLAGPPVQAKFDLEIQASLDDAGLHFNWHYAAALFEAGTVERMNAHFALLLDQVAAAPERPLCALAQLPAADSTLLAQWNATAMPFPAGDTLTGLFEAQVRRAPQAPALAYGDVQLSYAELDARANQLAWYLVEAHGVRPGTLVGHCVERSVDMVVALLAILKAGGAYVALEAGLPPERLAYMVADSGVATVLTRSDLQARLGTPPGVRLVALDERPQADYGTGPLPARSQADGLAYVIYTSGSTGQPKGTLNRHSGICNRLHAMQSQFALQPADRVLQKTPLSFDVSVWELFWPLSQGAVLVLAEPDGHKDPAYLAQVARTHAITVMHFVPSMLQMFLRAADPASLAGLRYLMTSGEALSQELQARCVDAFPDVRLINHYGPTETAVEVTMWPFGQLRADGVVPIGAPLPNVRIHILDRHDRPVPVGVAGELHIAGVQVGAGYLNRPALTAERFVERSIDGRPERLYRTGDRARWLADGNIEYLGRLDNQVKLRGMRIELGEIESVLRGVEGVADAAVLVDGELASQRLVCYLVAEEGGDPDAFLDKVRAATRQSLPAGVAPARFHVLPALPLSANGKVDRQALRQVDVAPSAAQRPRAPLSDLERTVLRIWASNLRMEEHDLSVHDNFFEIGGNSLLSIAVLADLKDALGRAVPVALIFQHPTVRQLARAIADSGAAPDTRGGAAGRARDRIAKLRGRNRDA